MNALFSSTGMAAAVLAIVLMQIASLGWLVAGAVEHRRIVQKHRHLFSAIEHGDAEFPGRRMSAILWLYVLSTLAVTLITTAIFLFQPHLL